MEANATTDPRIETTLRTLSRDTTIFRKEISTIEFEFKASMLFTNLSKTFENVTNIFNTSIVDMPNMDYESLLKRENANEAKALVPVTVYLVMLMIIGVIGNAIVLYVYKYRFRRSTSRIFILCLAIFDMITCLLGMPYHIIDMLYPYMFVWDTTCKVMSFSLTFTILSSIFILNLIAIDRYRKICKPFEKQLSGMGSKILSYVIVLVALICAIPMLFMYGSADIATRIANLTGKECYISDDYVETYFPMIYNGFIFLIFIISVCIFIGFYTKVGITVWKRRKFTESSIESKSSVSSQSAPSTSVMHLNVIADDVKIEHPAVLSVHFKKCQNDSAVQVLGSNAYVVGQEYSSPYKPTTSGVTKEKKKKLRIMSEHSSGEHDSSMSDPGSFITRIPKSHFATKKQKRTLRITIMLFVVTVIFIISFLPYLVISVVDGVDIEFWDRMTIGEVVLFNFLLRTYFINNMINPIIYWFLDHKFKEEVSRLFRDIRRCHRGTHGFHGSQKDFHS